MMLTVCRIRFILMSAQLPLLASSVIYVQPVGLVVIPIATLLGITLLLLLTLPIFHWKFGKSLDIFCS